MVEVLREKWCEDLEELMQCPVCFNRLKKKTVQCELGHSICKGCKERMEPESLCYCYSRFSETRNYLVESLSEKLDEIKLSLLGNEDSIDCKEWKTVALQTDIPVAVDKVIKRPKHTPPLAPKGKFRCRLGACESTLPHGRMISHIRYYHSNKFYEASNSFEQSTVTKVYPLVMWKNSDETDNVTMCTPTLCMYSHYPRFHSSESSTNGADTYKQVWEMDYYPQANFDLAIRIAELGLFFLRINVNQTGDLFGVVQIVSTATIGKEFEYELKVGSGRRNVSFKDTISSCRSSPTYLFESSDCLVIKHEDMEMMTAPYDHTFACTMILTRLEKENKPLASGSSIIL